MVWVRRRPTMPCGNCDSAGSSYLVCRRLARNTRSSVISLPMRVALIHNIVTPHVVPFYERLAAVPDVALTVYFLAETDKNRQWNAAIGQKFNYRLMPH